ncbi:Ion transport domain - like 5 [Theobroma cacao]|nr:Ion transport domain - like 5 [Theobroma cacao]
MISYLKSVYSDQVCGRKEPIRYMLWIRLSRALRVTEFFEKLEKDIRINYLFTRIVKLLVVEYYCTHAAGCIFYYLATTVPPSKEGYTWIGSLQMGEYHFSNFREIDIWKRYVVSLYFAVVTMVTVGYGDIHAVNVREMIFVMIYVSLDMILGAYLLGNMAALIVKGSKTERFRDKMTDLIKYMNRNNLEKQISKEIKGHLKLQYDRSYTEATVLQDIPASIRTKISQKLYEPFIKEVSLFKGCSTGFIKLIIHEAVFAIVALYMDLGTTTVKLQKFRIQHSRYIEQQLDAMVNQEWSFLFPMLYEMSDFNYNSMMFQTLKSHQDFGFIADFVKNLPFLVICQANKVHEEFFLPGEVIIEQGNVVDQLYIVCHGKLITPIIGYGLNSSKANKIQKLFKNKEIDDTVSRTLTVRGKLC